MERKDITTHRSSGKAWVLQFPYLMVELMAADLIHWGARESPWNTEFSGLINAQVQAGTPRDLTWRGSLTLSIATLWIMHSPLVEGPRDESGAFWGSLMVCDSLQDMTAACHGSAVEPAMPHQKGRTPSDRRVNVPTPPPGGIFIPEPYQDGGHWHAKERCPTSKDLPFPFSGSQTSLVNRSQFVVVSLRWRVHIPSAPGLFLWRAEIFLPLTPKLSTPP